MFTYNSSNSHTDTDSLNYKKRDSEENLLTFVNLFSKALSRLCMSFHLERLVLLAQTMLE